MCSDEENFVDREKALKPWVTHAFGDICFVKTSQELIERYLEGYI